VHRHHGVEEKCKVDTLGLAGKLEGLAIAIKGEGALGGGDFDRGFVVPR